MDDPNEHASYCALCNRPNYDGFAICNPCNAHLGEEGDDDGSDDDE
jgi:hypothetical protein